MFSLPARCPLWLPFLPIFLVLDFKKKPPWLLPLELNLGSFCPPCLLPLFVTQFGFLKSPPCLLPVHLLSGSLCVSFAWVSAVFFFIWATGPIKGITYIFLPLPAGSSFPKVRTAPRTDLFVCCPSNHFVGINFPSLPAAARLAFSFKASSLDLSFCFLLIQCLLFLFWAREQIFRTTGQVWKFMPTLTRQFQVPKVRTAQHTDHFLLPVCCCPIIFCCWGVLQFSSLHAAQ